MTERGAAPLSARRLVARASYPWTAFRAADQGETSRWRHGQDVRATTGSWAMQKTEMGPRVATADVLEHHNNQTVGPALPLPTLVGATWINGRSGRPQDARGGGVRKPANGPPDTAVSAS